jgi:hypothetical protein
MLNSSRSKSAAVSAARDPVRILLPDSVSHFRYGAVAPEKEDLRALSLQNPLRDVDRRVVTVRQRGSRHKSHRIHGQRAGHCPSPQRPTRTLPGWRTEQSRYYFDVQYYDAKTHHRWLSSSAHLEVSLVTPTAIIRTPDQRARGAGPILAKSAGLGKTQRGSVYRGPHDSRFDGTTIPTTPCRSAFCCSGRC